MKQFLLLLCFFFLSRLAFSQAGYEFGYIINNSGDTIKGKIKDRKFTTSPANSGKIKFIDAGGKQRKITPDQIKGYCRKGSVFYQTLPVGRESKLQFTKILERGNVILFGYTTNTFVSVNRSNDPHKKDTEDRVVEKIDFEYFYQRSKDPNSLMKVKKDKFESVSLFYFKDDAELIKKIEDKSLTYHDIELIVKMYNEFAAKI
jgi:hypothetical protein